MTASKSSQIDRWREQLAECERRLAERDTQMSWLRRAYLRIYRYLLATYAGVTKPEGESRPMPFVDIDGELDGKPARSLSQIQTTLKVIHNAQRPAKVGTPASREWYAVDNLWAVCNPADGLALLEQRGVKVRRNPKSGLLEVESTDWVRAEYFLSERQSQITPFTKRPIANPAAYHVLLPIAIIVLLSPLMFLTIATLARGTDAVDFSYAAMFFGACAAAILIHISIKVLVHGCVRLFRPGGRAKQRIPTLRPPRPLR
jgi:hypothetical protein